MITTQDLVFEGVHMSSSFHNHHQVDNVYHDGDFLFEAITWFPHPYASILIKGAKKVRDGFYYYMGHNGRPYSNKKIKKYFRTEVEEQFTASEPVFDNRAACEEFAKKYNGVACQDPYNEELCFPVFSKIEDILNMINDLKSGKINLDN